MAVKQVVTVEDVRERTFEVLDQLANDLQENLIDLRKIEDSLARNHGVGRQRRVLDTVASKVIDRYTTLKSQ